MKHKTGHYFVHTKLPLFDSETKFNSGTDGLVLCSFKQKNRVKEVDNSLGMVRGEIVCARCGHLGLLMMVPNPQD
jgi:peptide-methionine (R)-S-oxide reductase